MSVYCGMNFDAIIVSGKFGNVFKDFAENDWPDIKDHLTEKGQQDGDFLKQNGGKAYQNSVKAFKKAVRNLDQKVNGTSIHKDDK